MKSQLRYTCDPSRCPKCGSENIEGGSLDVEYEYVHLDLDCADCGFSYHDDYALVGYWPRVGHGDDDNGPTLIEHLQTALKKKDTEVKRLRERIDALIDLLPTSDYFDTVQPALVEVGLMRHHTDCPEGGENFMWIDGEICHACGTAVSE